MRITAAFAAEYVPDTVAPESERVSVELTRQGDHYAGTFRADAVGKGADGALMVGVYVEFDHGGPAREQAMFLVELTPAHVVPARFTGEFRESLVDGSLVVEAGVDVKTPGYYLVDANLHDHAGRPVAWTRFKGDLRAGPSFVALSFFGKVLADAQTEGPFRVESLRGRRHVAGRDPESDLMPSLREAYETKGYARAAFSRDAWDSPTKRARLARLEERFGYH